MSDCTSAPLGCEAKVGFLRAPCLRHDSRADEDCTWQHPSFSGCSNQALTRYRQYPLEKQLAEVRDFLVQYFRGKGGPDRNIQCHGSQHRMNAYRSSSPTACGRVLDCIQLNDSFAVSCTVQDWLSILIRASHSPDSRRPADHERPTLMIVSSAKPEPTDSLFAITSYWPTLILWFFSDDFAIPPNINRRMIRACRFPSGLRRPP